MWANGRQFHPLATYFIGWLNYIHCKHCQVPLWPYRTVHRQQVAPMFTNKNDLSQLCGQMGDYPHPLATYFIGWPNYILCKNCQAPLWPYRTVHRQQVAPGFCCQSQQALDLHAETQGFLNNLAHLTFRTLSSTSSTAGFKSPINPSASASFVAVSAGSSMIYFANELDLDLLK